MTIWLSWLMALLIVYILQIGAVLVLEYRRPTYLTAWLLIVFMIPFAGFIAYMMLGKDFNKRKRMKQFKLETIRYANHLSEKVAKVADMGNEEMEKQEKLFAMLTGLAPFPVTKNNETEILTNGKETFEAIFEALEQAVHHIHMDYYTIRDDEIGRRLLQILIKKANEGVEVRVVYDGIGSLHLSKTYIEELHQAGIQTSCFLPPRIAFFDHKLNYRNHRKIVVVDGKVGFIGGINIGDEYLGKDPKLGFWRDTHLRLKGDSVYYLQELFMNDWAFSSQEKLDGKVYMPPHGCEGKERVLMIASKPGQHNHKIEETMFAAITAATKRIYIATPYFIPDPSLLMGIRTAALSGVDVKIIIPYVADSKLILLATLSYIQEMLEAGVKVYRYEKGFIHAKVMIVDKMLATVGTANVDMRSLHSNFELNAMLFDIKAINKLETDFLDDLKNIRHINENLFNKRSTRQKAAEALLHMLSPLL